MLSVRVARQKLHVSAREVDIRGYLRSPQRDTSRPDYCSKERTSESNCRDDPEQRDSVWQDLRDWDTISAQQPQRTWFLGTAKDLNVCNCSRLTGRRLEEKQSLERSLFMWPGSSEAYICAMILAVIKFIVRQATRVGHKAKLAQTWFGNIAFFKFTTLSNVRQGRLTGSLT